MRTGGNQGGCPRKGTGAHTDLRHTAAQRTADATPAGVPSSSQWTLVVHVAAAPSGEAVALRLY